MEGGRRTLSFSLPSTLAEDEPPPDWLATHTVKKEEGWGEKKRALFSLPVLLAKQGAAHLQRARGQKEEGGRKKTTRRRWTRRGGEAPRPSSFFTVCVASQSGGGSSSSNMEGREKERVCASPPSTSAAQERIHRKTGLLCDTYIPIQYNKTSTPA